MRVEVHLLDYLAWRAGCACLSDLHRPGPGQRTRLRRAPARPCTPGPHAAWLA